MGRLFVPNAVVAERAKATRPLFMLANALYREFCTLGYALYHHERRSNVDWREAPLRVHSGQLGCRWCTQRLVGEATHGLEIKQT